MHGGEPERLAHGLERAEVAAGADHAELEADLTRQKFIHIHQQMFTASNQKQVYGILNNCCICINIGCGDLLGVGGEHGLDGRL